MNGENVLYYGMIVFGVMCLIFVIFDLWFFKSLRTKHQNKVLMMKKAKASRVMELNKSFVKQVTGKTFVPTQTLNHFGETKPVKPLYETDKYGFVLRSSITTDDYYETYYCPYCGTVVENVISEVPHTTRHTEFYYCESCNIVLTEVDEGVSIDNE